MKKTLLVFGIVVIASLAVALITDSRSTGLFILNSAIKLSRAQTVETDVFYGSQPWQKLNVYPQDNLAPVVIFFHGGAWYTGNKEQYHFAADSFARLGYVVVVPDYIKYPEGRFPRFVEDGAEAVSWVKANIEKFNGDPNRVFISGHSAGAHIGALLVTDKSYLAAAGASIQDVAGFAGIAGPYNFTPEWPQYVETFGPENFEIMKANYHVDGSEPPILLIHAQGDTEVGLFNVQTFTSKLQEVESHVDNILYDDQIDHISIVLKLHPWFAEEVDVAADIHKYFSQYSSTASH